MIADPSRSYRPLMHRGGLVWNVFLSFFLVLCPFLSLCFSFTARNRFRQPAFRIYVSAWRAETKPARRQRLSAQYRKAWEASFPLGPG